MLIVDFINVGYGDSILVRDTDTLFSLLIDCGDTDLGIPYDGSKRISAADFLLREGVTSLDLLILTHLHRDHIGGALQVIRAVPVKEVWTNCLPGAALWNAVLPQKDEWTQSVNNFTSSINVYTEALNRLRRSGAKRTLLNSAALGGAVYARQLTQKLRVECTFAEPERYRRQDVIIENMLKNAASPNTGEIAELDKSVNGTSIRCVFTYEGSAIALGADVSAESWLKAPPRECTVLKASHHGHPDSLCQELLSRVKPECIVLSVSNDRADPCPHPDTIALIKKFARQWFVTDAFVSPGFSDGPRHSSVRCAFDNGAFRAYGYNA
jgi:beta-lactamase superfamily II metal-dependent hydrolase